MPSFSMLIGRWISQKISGQNYYKTPSKESSKEKLMREIEEISNLNLNDSEDIEKMNKYAVINDIEDIERIRTIGFGCSWAYNKHGHGAFFYRIIADYRNDSEDWRKLGEVLEKDGQIEKAIDAYRKAIDLGDKKAGKKLKKIVK